MKSFIELPPRLSSAISIASHNEKLIQFHIHEYSMDLIIGIMLIIIKKNH